MTTFIVRWTTEIEAADATQAAEQALEDVKNLVGGYVFEVMDETSGRIVIVRIES